MKGLFLILLSSLFLCLTAQDMIGQSDVDTLAVDTLVKKEKKGSIFSGRPGKAMLMSLIIPGAGQIYNKSYLRVPFVWGAVGGMGYLVYDNTHKYQCRKAAYEAAVDNVPYVAPHDDCEEELKDITDPATLRTLRDDANEARQLAIVGFTLVWIANGVDAFVNAHLKEFDINEDLTIEIGSRFDNDPYAPMRAGIFVQF